MTTPLPFIALLLGAFLIVKHLFALVAPAACSKMLISFPRSRPWGLLLMSLAGVWTFALAATIDLGEFASLRTTILIAIVVSALLFTYFVPSFLAVRALGFLLLLLGHALLEITFLKTGLLSIALSLLAYIWVITAFFFIGMPYVLRNAITALSQERYFPLWRLLSLTGLFYGLLLIIVGGKALLN